MRIILSNASPGWGGVHQVTEDLAAGLQRRGHAVLLLCRPGSALEERMRGVAPLEPVLRGMDFHPVTLARAAGALRRFRPAVVLALTKKDVRLTAPAARALGVPVVVRHANDRPLRDGLYHRLLYGGLPACHIANSAATRRTLLDSAPWLDPSRVEAIHNGVDVDSFSVPAAELGLPAGAIAVGFVGRFDERKGVLDLAAAWPQVAEAAPDAHLVVVGTGPMEAEMRRLLDGVARIHWLGLRRDVPAVMKALDVVAMPSHWEGFGLVAVEAMAAGRPVVATRVSSLPEIVRDGVDGLLVPPAAPGPLAEALSELASDAGLRARMGEAGHARARSAFSLTAMLDAYEELVARVAG